LLAFHSANFEGVKLGQVAVYCRVSTDDQSCERQERDLRAFAKRAGHKIVATFRETASGADNARPERAKVLALARAHDIDAILVTELSRWGRSTQDLVQTLDDLHGWKVSVLAQTGLSFDLSTSSGKLMRTIMAGLAEFERDLIRERIRSGLASAKARGVKLGSATGSASVGQEGQEGSRPSQRRVVLPVDRPQRRAQQEYGHGDSQARRRAIFPIARTQAWFAHHLRSPSRI
jgi:putative DNA-invertase from lambdoid prophage Rac